MMAQSCPLLPWTARHGPALTISRHKPNKVIFLLNGFAHGPILVIRGPTGRVISMTDRTGRRIGFAICLASAIFMVWAFAEFLSKVSELVSKLGLGG